ncbi:MAG: restriction endonuclease [Alphaproteobacteria bacterium]|nr:restriction endonuclease [Alphaproteobacteria bacterium]
MKIAEYYSHLNGLEFIQVHKPKLWKEIKEVIASVDAEKYRTKISKEKTMMGAKLYSPVELNKAMREGFAKHKWEARTAAYWVTKDAKLIRKTLNLPPDEQRKAILAEGQEATRSHNQTDFVKDRVAVEVQFGKYFSVAYDLFVKHLAFYVGDLIDVGVEIVPMKSLSASTLGDDGKRARAMSTGVPWYEKELYNLIREGRGVPGVPLVIVGVAA